MIVRIVAIILVAQNCFGQYLSSFDFQNKLSQNTIIAMAQDNDGFLWLGTADGLNRYDGRNIVTYRKSRNETQTITGNEITVIEKDSLNNLWIGTSTGLSKLDLTSYLFTNYNLISSGLQSNYILDLKVLNDNLYVLTSDGLSVLDVLTGRFNTSHALSKLNIDQITIGGSHELVYSLDNSVYAYNYKQQEIRKILDLKNSNQNIQKLYNHQDYLCVAYPDELVTYNLKDKVEYKFTGYDFLDTRNINYWDNQIYFGTSKGLIGFDLIRKNYIEQKEGQLPPSVVLHTLVNSTNELIVSLGTGLVALSNEKPVFETINVDNSADNYSGTNKIWHICNEMNMIILSTERGIKVLDKDGHITSLSSMVPFVPDILFASNVIRDMDNIWICTFDEGFYHIDLKKRLVNNYSTSKTPPYFISSNTVRHSMQTDSIVYISTDSGLYVFDKFSHRIELLPLERESSTIIHRVSCTLLDAENNLWIGTQDGLYSHRPNGKVSYHSTQSDNPISHNRIRSLKLLSDSILLVGTSSGLNYYNISKGTNSIIGIEYGLKNDVINSIEIDKEDDIWVSTNMGISLIDKDFDIINYNEFDGLPGNEFNTNASTLDADGYLYFGSLNGLAKFNSISAKNIVTEINPVITEIEILPHDEFQGVVHSYPLKKSYTFKNEHSNFIIRFSNINFNNPENDNFEYRLLGYSDRWVRVLEKLEVQFMNLEQGQYSFQLRGIDRNGKHSDFISSIDIIIEPAYYNSKWFRFLALTVLVGLIGLLVLYRIRQSDKRNRELVAIIKEQTEDLEYSNKLKEEYLKQVPEPLVIFDRDKNIILSNDLFEELNEHHYKNDEAKSQFLKFLDDNISEGIDKIRLGNDTYKLTRVYKDVHFELTFSELILDSKEYGISVLVRDVSQIAKAEISLIKSDALFRSYFEKSPIGIIYIEDPSQNIVNCNTKFCQIVKMSKDEVLTKTMMDLSHPVDLEKDTISFKSAYSRGQQYLFEPNKRLLSSDGVIAVTETHVTFIYDDSGKYQYMFALINDVTDQRENQKKLIEVKTKLIQSEKLASLGQLTAGVAHEINNPVNFIYNGVNNLKRLVESIQTNNEDGKELIYTEIQQMISAIDEGAKRTTDIVKSLRMFTKEDIKNKIPYDIIVGLESSLLLLKYRTKDRIRIEKTFNSQKIILNCYPSQLNQVFMNVITNAIEAISQSGTITITADTNMSDAVISIKDTGSGISPNLYSKVFEPFYSSKGAKNGTGLGLSISHSIIEKHNGTISIGRNHPKGTIVTISIPII